MATFKAVVFSTLNHIKTDGTTNIKIRIYHNKESQYIPTGYFIEPHFMNDNGEIIPTYNESDLLNYQISEIIQTYRKSHILLGPTANRMSCAELKEYLVRSSDLGGDYIDFVQFSKTIIEGTKKEKTAIWYQQSLDALKWYWKREKINVNDINSIRLTEFMEKLSVCGPAGYSLEPGTISNYLRGVRALFNKCKKHYNKEAIGIIKIHGQPFKEIHIPEYKKKRKNINVEKVILIRDCSPTSERDVIARDMFMIMFYLMGINVNDLYNINRPIGKRIEYERSKTSTERNEDQFPLSIKIEPELKELIDKYSDEYFMSVVKKRYKNSYNFMKAINTGLKNICESLEIQKVTTNWARHSWASIARNIAKIPKADVDFCLGHVTNDHKMADIYIDIDYSIFDDANRKVLDLLKKKKKSKK